VNLSSMALSPTQVGITPKVKETKRLVYAGELECDEPNTRHWMHSWCEFVRLEREV